MQRQRSFEKARVRVRAAIIAVFVMASLSMAAASSSPAASARLDVNSATVGELTELPGIGPSKAAAIVEEREVAPFKSVDDLARVRGIGDATLDELREHITVGKSAAKSARAEAASKSD
jgi:competence protein ComEA